MATRCMCTDTEIDPMCNGVYVEDDVDWAADSNEPSPVMVPLADYEELHAKYAQLERDYEVLIDRYESFKALQNETSTEIEEEMTAVERDNAALIAVVIALGKAL